MIWRRFTAVFAVAAAVAVLVLMAVPIAFDPYGLRAAPGRPPGPIMDLNQRYMYPQIVRSGLYDSAVIGTSTMRLLDPEVLDRSLNGRFANLAMNAATPWEQMQIASLFVREATAPKTLLLGLDPTWCEADADAPGKRLTFRSFPPWLYDAPAPLDWLRMFDLRSVEIGLRVAAFRLGRQKARIRGDGYEVFTPPESTYDLARARGHIWAGGGPRPRPVSEGIARPDPALAFPALVRLGELAASLPASTRLLILFPPAHVAVQPLEGSEAARREAACKAAVLSRFGGRATILDMRFPSPITGEDANYWDPLHYRLPIAARIDAILAQAARAGTAEDPAARILH